MEGLVTKSTGSWYKVYLKEVNRTIEARLKGVFRLQDSPFTNPIAVGDIVTIDQEQGDFVISDIKERTNYIIRQSPKHKVSKHIIASNMDLAVVVACVSSPRTSTGFIDRFLLAAESFNIPSLLVIHKIDSYKDKDLRISKEWVDLYSNAGYEVLETSIVSKIGIEALTEKLRGKNALFSGHSGVGKSSLLNAIDPSFNVRIGAISKIHQKGMHTTTYAELFFLEGIGATIIDTPGIKEFGVQDIEENEVSHFFKEMVPYFNRCKFDNCLHENEPECRVKEAVESGKIHTSRYTNYLNILDDVKNQRKNWE
jgi:ribosome biogenesis GTPase